MLLLCRRLLDERRDYMQDLVYDTKTQAVGTLSNLYGTLYKNVTAGSNGKVSGCGFSINEISFAGVLPKQGYYMVLEEYCNNDKVSYYVLFDYGTNSVRKISYTELLQYCDEGLCTLLNYSVVRNGGKLFLRKKPGAVVNSIVLNGVPHMDTFGSMSVLDFVELLKKYKFTECLRYKYNRIVWGNKLEVLECRVFYKGACIVGCTRNVNEGDTTLSYYGGDMALQCDANGAINVLNGCSGGMFTANGRNYLSVSRDIREGLFNTYNQYKDAILPSWVLDDMGDVYATSIVTGHVCEDICNNLNPEYRFPVASLLDAYMFIHNYKHMTKASKRVFANLFKEAQKEGSSAEKQLGAEESKRLKDAVKTYYVDYGVTFTDLSVEGRASDK